MLKNSTRNYLFFTAQGQRGDFDIIAGLFKFFTFDGSRINSSLGQVALSELQVEKLSVFEFPYYVKSKKRVPAKITFQGTMKFWNALFFDFRS